MQVTNTRPFYNRFLCIVSRYKWGHRSWLTILIYRYIDHVAAGNVTYVSSYHVFGHDLDSNLHARSSYIVHFAVDSNNISDKSGSQKIKSLHPGLNHSRALSVFDRHNGTRLIPHTHNDASIHFPLSIP